MVIFNSMLGDKYPVMRFCKTLNNGDDYEILAEVKDVQFYDVKGKNVEVWTYPTNADNMKVIKNVDFVNTFKNYD